MKQPIRKQFMKLIPLFAAFAFTFLTACQISFTLPWQEKAEDDSLTIALLALLGARGAFGSSSSSSCSNSSGMVICVPGGLAE